MKKIVSIVDSFKSCASSYEINEAILSAFSDRSCYQTMNIPIADGGEGTLDCISHNVEGKIKNYHSFDPIMRPIDGKVYFFEIDGQQIALVESAEFIGIDKTIIDDSTIRKSSSYGLGYVIKKICNTEHVDKVFISLGGSGTSDGGLGFLEALEIISDTHEDSLNPLTKIDDIELDYNIINTLPELVGLVDVKNPYSGSQGFANVFAKQKGANQDTIQLFEEHSSNLVDICANKYHINLNKISGTGAAGGLGGAIILAGGKLADGFKTICKLINLDKKVREADLIFTGEGSLDAQTLYGKVPYQVAQLGNKYSIPVIAISGRKDESLGELDTLLTASFSIQREPTSLENAMKNCYAINNIKVLTKNICNLIEGMTK